MKTKIAAILLLILFHTKSYSQEYIPLLNNSSWIILVSDFESAQNNEINQSDDVEIGIYTYKKYVDQNNQEFLLREDIVTKQVYKLIDGNDILLYDFSLEVLDNITLLDGDNYQVQSINNVNINGGQRRQYNLRNLTCSFCPDEVWIEGVGRRTHPLLAKNEFFTDPEYYLMCSFQNGINIFNQGIANGGTATTCSLVVDEQNYLSKKITFAPNPFESELIIYSQSNLNNSTIKVFNSIGQKVREIKNVSGEKFTLQRENLKKGLYLIQLTENGIELAAKKLIIK